MLNIVIETGKDCRRKAEAGKGEKAKRSLKRYLLEKVQVWINESPFGSGAGRISGAGPESLKAIFVPTDFHPQLR